MSSLYSALMFARSGVINVNPDHFVHITASARHRGPVKNCSLFELVKTNNQDQQRATKLSPDRPEERETTARHLADFFIGLRSVKANSFL